MPDVETYDNVRWTVSVQCQRCPWKFRCAVEQMGRWLCRNCESKWDAAQAKETQ
jgi:hypothetical protein